MTGPSLRAIFFDVDDTLYSTSEFSARARDASLEAMIQAGLAVPLEELRVDLEEVIAEFSPNHEHHFDKLLLRLPRRAYKGRNPACIIAAGVVAYHAVKARELVPYEDAVEVLRMLSTRTDLILGVITAGLAVKQAEKLVRLKVLDYLRANAIFISDQIGINKPNVKLYQRALSDLNLKPSESMYVGDHPHHDMDAARAAGMITVWNRRGGKHAGGTPASPPDHVIQNFWDLLEVLEGHYGLKPQGG
ncbi:MAG: HAD-IA family hydrolase [Planctomycetes bacterium]|nr:HAD-IA family hydrolase [Planctomycetota bacterium]